MKLLTLGRVYDDTHENRQSSRVPVFFLELSPKYGDRAKVWFFLLLTIAMCGTVMEIPRIV
jgi:hypothetical protein